jgi:hypothetical protein
MRAWGDGHVVAGYRGGASPRWREAAAVAAAAAPPLTVCTAAAQPALAAGGYTRGVIAYLTKPLDSFIAGHDRGADPAPRTVPAP